MDVSLLINYLEINIKSLYRFEAILLILDLKATRQYGWEAICHGTCANSMLDHTNRTKLLDRYY